MNQHNEHITYRYAQTRQAELAREAQARPEARPERGQRGGGRRVLVTLLLAGAVMVAMSLTWMILVG